MHKSLGAFIRALEETGELKRIPGPVSPVLEIGAIGDFASKSEAPRGPSESAKRSDPRFWSFGGPAVLIEKVEGSDFPLLINGWGSYRRMEMALGCEGGGFAEIGERIGELVKPEPPRSLKDAIAKAKLFAPLLKVGPKRRKKDGACQEVVKTGDEIDLTRMPIIRCWPLDGDFEAVGYPAGVNDGIAGLGHPDIDDAEWARSYRGRYITLAGIHTIHADDAGEARPSSHNIGMYRVQLLGRDRVAMHWHMHHDGAAHWRSWVKRGEPMPVAIVLGGESVLPYAATAPLPPGISELLMAGFLNRGGIEMVRAKTVPLWVPANAEIVIEGFVSHEAGPIGYDPRTGEELGPEAVFEGPFGDHTGFYSMPDRYPIVKVTAVTHRRDAVYPTTVVGLPLQEDYFLGKATERIFLPLLKTLIHDIEDYDLPVFGAFHNCAAIKIGKQYPMQARRVMHAVWGAGQMAWTKTVFVVDSGVDVHDARAVLRAAAEHCDPAHDCERVRGPLDILDHAAPWLGSGGKMGFDCTPKWPGEEAAGGRAPTSPRPIPGPEATERALAEIRGIDGVADAAHPASPGGWLFVATDRRGGEGFGALVEAIEEVGRAGHWGGPGPAIVVIVGEGVRVEDPDEALFHWLANADMARDQVVKARDGRGTVYFDSTPKLETEGGRSMPVRAWPPLIEMDAEVSRRVLERYASIGVRPKMGRDAVG